MKINKITKVYPNSGAPINECDIQDHMDAMNADGWYLIEVIELGGWYRLFWEKETVE